MASTSKFVYLFVMVLFCLALTQPPSDQWNCGHGCFYAVAAAQVIPNRKVLSGMDGNEVISEGTKVQGLKTNGYGRGSEELREAPSGPDPLHHRGGSPKKARTP